MEKLQIDLAELLANVETLKKKLKKLNKSLPPYDKSRHAGYTDHAGRGTVRSE
jgi:pantothenate kinase-related protein Tda10